MTRLQGVPVGKLTPTQIDDLVLAKAGESRLVDFKLALPGTTAGDKKEFLADVSAFANTSGGVILYGIETQRDANDQDTGIADRVAGLPGINTDKEKQRLLAMAHDGVSPSLSPFVTVQSIESPTWRGPVLAVGIAASLARPHMIIYEKSNRFWRRSDVGKYQPDLVELRGLFQETASWLEGADAFRRRRITEVRNSVGLLRLLFASPLFIHVLPLGRQASLLDLRAHEGTLPAALLPPWAEGYSWQFNADGFLTFSSTTGNAIRGYTQWFRFGGVEGYDGRTISVLDDTPGRQDRRLWASDTCRQIEHYVRNALNAQTRILEIDPPFAVLVSLVGLKDSVLYDGQNAYPRGQPIKRDDLFLPPVVVEDTGADEREFLAPVLDIIWQAYGISGMPKRYR